MTKNFQKKLRIALSLPKRSRRKSTKETVALLSTGNVNLQTGRFVTKEEIDAKRARVLFNK